MGKLKSKILILIFILSAGSINSCKKGEISDFELETENLKVYHNIDISMPIQMIASGNRLLCVYGVGEFDGEMRAMLLDSDGTFIKEIVIGEIDFAFSFYAVAKTNGFVLKVENRLIEMDLNGTIMNDVPDFFAQINIYDVYGMLINNAGNYLVYGQYKGYAFVAEYSPAGQLNYKTLFFNQHPDAHYFTGGVTTTDGGAMLYGCQFQSNTEDQVYYIIAKISAAGDVEWRKKYTAGESAGELGGQLAFTGEIVDLFNGQYMLFTNSTSRDREELYARAYKMNSNGELLDSLRIAIGGLNMIAGTKGQSHSAYPWRPVGAGVARTSGTAVMGIVLKSDLGLPQFSPSFSKPHQSARFKITEEFEIEHIENIQNAYTDYITSMCQLSDGRVVAYGMLQSLGGDFRPVLIFYSN